MGLIKIEFEKNHSVKDIQDEFRKYLSEKEILRGTARALNDAANRVQGHIRKEIRKEFTINNKYLSRASQVSHKATANTSDLYASVAFSNRPIPMIGFKHSARPKQKNIPVKDRRPISVTITKGKTVFLKRAFFASFRSGHTGLYEAGSYDRGRFIHEKVKTSTGRTKITEMKAPSPFGMAFSERMQPKITKYVDGYLPGRVKFFLEQQLSKMRK